MFLGQAEIMQLVGNFGAAGIVGAMWLVESYRNRIKDKQIEVRDAKILEDGVKIAQLVRVVQENTAAFTSLKDELSSRPCVAKHKSGE